MDWIKLLTHPVVLECIKWHILIEIDNGRVTIGGFYKSDVAELVLDDNTGELFAYTRYDQKDKIETFKDLVELNYDWWEKSKFRHPNWKIPATKWLYLMRDYGFISIETDEVMIVKEIK